MSMSEAELRELRKAATKGLKQVMKSLKEEPSTVIVVGSETEDSEEVIKGITSWLFRREEDGRSNS